MFFSRLSFYNIGIALYFCLAGQVAQAWSGKVHVQLGNTVFELLSEKEQAYYQKLAQALPKKDVPFNNMSNWVDAIRGEPLYEVFKQRVPKALHGFRQRHTGTWHYENEFYDGNLKFHDVKGKHSCRMENKGNLEAALIAIDKALKGDTSSEQEAILIAFAMHLMEDLHQPLHTTALVRADCSHDRGGNLYCLNVIAGRCVVNLHSLWDQAFNAANDSGFLRSIKLADKPLLPLRTRIALKLYQGHELARKAYNIQENKPPNAAYIEWARGVTELQLEQSVQDVTHYLKSHYETKSSE